MSKVINKAISVYLVFVAILSFSTLGAHWGEPNAVYIFSYGIAILAIAVLNYLLDKKQEFVDLLLEERKHRYEA